MQKAVVNVAVRKEDIFFEVEHGQSIAGRGNKGVAKSLNCRRKEELYILSDGGEMVVLL